GTLLEWLKKEGDKVKSGEVIGTIQTDKATLELEAPGSGTLSGLLIENGATVPVGRPIAAILADGESLPAGWKGGNGKPVPSAEPPRGEVTSFAPEASAKDASLPSDAGKEPAPSAALQTKPLSTPVEGRVKASPLAKRIAADLGVDLGNLSGSGPGGR